MYHISITSKTNIYIYISINSKNTVTVIELKSYGRLITAYEITRFF